MQLVVEAERDRESVNVGLQVPELVLEDDGHVRRVALAEKVGDDHARMLSAKGDVEVVRRGDALAPGPGEYVAHDPAQRALDEASVIDARLPHAVSSAAGTLKGSWGDSVARLPPGRGKATF